MFYFPKSHGLHAFAQQEDGSVLAVREMSANRRGHSGGYPWVYEKVVFNGLKQESIGVLKGFAFPWYVDIFPDGHQFRRSRFFRLGGRAFLCGDEMSYTVCIFSSDSFIKTAQLCIETPSQGTQIRAMLDSESRILRLIDHFNEARTILEANTDGERWVAAVLAKEGVLRVISGCGSGRDVVRRNLEVPSFSEQIRSWRLYPCRSGLLLNSLSSGRAFLVPFEGEEVPLKTPPKVHIFDLTDDLRPVYRPVDTRDNPILNQIGIGEVTMQVGGDYEQVRHARVSRDGHSLFVGTGHRLAQIDLS